MFFADTPFEEPDLESFSEEEREDWETLESGQIEYGSEEGVVLTDDWNPVDRWTALVNEAWRKRIFSDMGPEILTY